MDLIFSYLLEQQIITMIQILVQNITSKWLVFKKYMLSYQYFTCTLVSWLMQFYELR